MIREELLNDIATGVWHIEQKSAQVRFPLVYDIITKAGKPADADWSAARAENMPITISANSQKNTTEKGAEQKVGVAYLRGAVTKYNQFSGARGTKSLAEDIRSFDNNPEIAGTVLVIDSPGGSVNAHRILEDAIRNSTKPVVAYVDGMAASAAYGIAASTREIIISQKTDILGSIGTMMTYLDAATFYKAQGYDYKELYSRLSPQKNKGFRELRAGNEEDVKNDLDVYAQMFIDDIKSYRGNLISKAYEKDIYEGRDLMGDKAIEAGLADAYGSLQDAANRVIELKNQDKMSESKFKNLLSFFGKTETEQEENLEKLDQVIASKEAAEQNIQELTAQLAELQASNEANEKANEELVAQNTVLTLKVSELEEKLDKTPENTGSEIIPSADADQGNAQAKKPWAKTPWMQDAKNKVLVKK